MLLKYHIYDILAAITNINLGSVLIIQGHKT